MSSQSSGSKRKRTGRSNLGNLLHPGEWRNKRARSGSPSASGASTPGAGPNSSAQSNASSRSPSPVGHPGPSHPTTSSTRNATGNKWTGLEKVLQALCVTAKICPPLSMAVDELVLCLPKFKAAAENNKDYEVLSTGLEGMVEQLDRHLKETTSEGIIGVITGIAEAIRKEIESIDVKKPGSLPPSRRMEAASSADDDLIRRYRRIEQLFRQLQGEASMSTWNTVNEIRVEQHLKDLCPAKLAMFDSELSTEVSRRGCTKDTRIAILEECMVWSEDPDLAKVYWMNGMAGTGKTTIAYSLCERLETGKQLAASFFCTRASPECREAKRIVPTIAYQLARRFAPFRHSLCLQLKQNADISTGQLSNQFHLLLKKPLLAAKDKLSNNLVVVIDALDECTDPHIVELFLGLIFRSATELPVKFFVTSRPEPAIRNTMMPESERSRSILYLHEIERSLVQADIELYLRDELESIALTDDDITELAEHAGNLFIYAATAVRYIRPVGIAVNSKARLKAILAISAESQKKLSAIDTLYTAILTAAIDHPELEPEERSQMRLVIWTAVCACEPIPTETLSVLSGLDNKDDAMAALQPLRSVLHVSDRSELVTTLHASFPDYMFSQDRSGVFHCDKSAHSRLLAKQCFKIMKAQLRFNICCIQSSFIPNKKIPEFEGRIIASISEELLYSCRFWADHLSETNSLEAPPLWVHDFLCHRLLFWMEVMSLKNCMATGAMIMIKLNTWLSQVHPKRPADLFDLASDAQAFVAKYSLSPASACTPHIYLSALPLSPPSSLVRMQYLPHFKGLIKVSGKIVDNTKAAIGIWAFGSSVRSVTFSPRGDLIILGDEEGRISVHNAHDGKSLVQPFKAHRKLVASLAVSNDGMRILSGSHDKKVSIWNIHDGSLISGPYKGHKNRVTSVAFSSDAARIASGSDDCRIRIWNPRNANDLVGLLRGHAKEVKSVAFSPNGSRVISGSADRMIRVWDLSSESTVLILHGHAGGVSSIQFSPDGTHIISGSYDTTVRIWNASDGSLSRILEGHSKRITSTSPSEDLIVSGSLDCTVRVWNMHTGELVTDPFEGHSDSVRCVGISSDGMRVMSASDDKTVRVWNVQRQTARKEKTTKRPAPTATFTSSPNQTHFATYNSTEPNVHVWDLRTVTHVVIPTGADIKHLQFSLDGTRIYSLCDPGTLCTWDTQTAEIVDGPHHCSPLGIGDSAARSADGTHVVVCRDTQVTLWHVQSNRSIVLHTGEANYYDLGVAFSHDGTRFVTFGSGTRGPFSRLLPILAVWDGDSGASIIEPFVGHIVGFSFDGTYLCWASSWGGAYQLINTKTGGKTSITSYSGPVFSPEGFHLAVSDDHPPAIRTWDTLGKMFAPGEIASMTSGLQCFKVFRRPLHGWLLVSYPTQEGCHVCRFHIDHPPFVISPDGWILDGQKQRLFWVPTEIRKDFPGCNGAVVSGGGEVLLCVDYGDLLVGDNWSQCYAPDVIT